MSNWIHSSGAALFSPTSYTGEEAFMHRQNLQEGMLGLSQVAARVQREQPHAMISSKKLQRSDSAPGRQISEASASEKSAFNTGYSSLLRQAIDSVHSQLRPSASVPSWDSYQSLTAERKETLTALWLSLSPPEREQFCPNGQWQWKVSGTPSHAMVLAAMKGLFSAAEVLLKDCFHHSSEEGLKVVNECLDLGHIEGAYAFLKSGLPWPSDPGMLSKGNAAQRTLAWMAAQRGDGAFLKELIARGANVDVPDKDHWTPLLVASNNGHLAAVQSLARGHVNVDVMDVAGWMPLHRASFHGHPEVAKSLLLEMGATADIPDHLGRTPLHRAVEHNHVELVQLLCTHAEVDPDRAGYVQGYGTPVSSRQLALDRKQLEICYIFDRADQKSSSQ